MSAERHSFQTETKSLMRLMIHSLYSNKEIFLRELISNASDACDKLRYQAISNPELMDDQELAVKIIPDKEAGTVTIRDNGIGMSREELMENLGTIAKSGTKEFLGKLTGDQAKDSQLIGQFGVGFYSAFIVADKVTVQSRKAGDSAAAQWVSEGEGEFEVGDCDKDSRGTDIVLHLRDDEKEFLEVARLSHVARKYSDHISLPVKILKDAPEPKEGEEPSPPELETLNQGGAFWTRPKNELKDEDYQNFYKHLSHDWEEAACWAHHKVEGNLEYTSLIYIPKRAPFELWNRESHNGLHLYVKRVFIMDKAAELLPPYLRFVRGLVDTADLPLNVSREILQGSRTTEKIKAALIKRVLDLLDDMAANRPAEFKDFWKTFGGTLKEGLVEDANNKERISKLVRVASTKDPDGELCSLADYVSRMPEGQQSIYYLTAESIKAAQSSPHLEGYAKQGYEVLLMVDRIDEWVMGHLTEFDGKPMKSVAQGAAELDDKADSGEKEKQESEFKEVLERVKNVLGERIQEVKLSTRLTESPSCLVAPDFGMSRRLEQMLQMGGENVPGTKPILELNADHPMMARMKETNNEALFEDFAELLYGQAQLAEGGQLDDPGAFVKRLNKLVLGEAPTGRIIV